MKTFAGRSFVHEFESAIGQYLIYRTFLKSLRSPARVILAIDATVYERHFHQLWVQLIVREYSVNLLVVSVETEEVIQWIG